MEDDLMIIKKEHEAAQQKLKSECDKMKSESEKIKKECEGLKKEISNKSSENEKLIKDL